MMIYIVMFFLFRFGFKIEEPNGVKLKNVGARVLLWLNMDYMVPWFVIHYLYLIQFLNLLEKEKVNVHLGY